MQEALDNVGLAVLLGGILLLAGLLAVRFHWRAALVTMITVPVSLATAGVTLQLLGQGLNALVFAGMAAAVASWLSAAAAQASGPQARTALPSGAHTL